MIEHFNGIIYLIVFAIHFLAYAVYGYRCIVSTKSFLDQYGADHSAATMTRFFGAMFLGSVLMASYIIFLSRCRGNNEECRRSCESSKRQSYTFTQTERKKRLLNFSYKIRVSKINQINIWLNVNFS